MQVQGLERRVRLTLIACAAALAGALAVPAASPGAVTDAGYPPPESNPPNNEFTLDTPKSKKNGKATIVATVPGPGALRAGDDVNDAGLVRGARGYPLPKPLLKPTTADATGAGAVTLTLKPTKRAKKKLKQRGRVTANAEVIYTPTGGEPASRFTDVKLKRKGK